MLRDIIREKDMKFFERRILAALGCQAITIVKCLKN